MTVVNGTRLIRVSVDLLPSFGTRTEEGDRLTAEWGEPTEQVVDVFGVAEDVYTPTFTKHCHPQCDHQKKEP